MQTNTMPRPPSDNTFQVAFKIPDSWIAMADQIANQMSRPGVSMTRTDALRAALWHGLNELRAQPEASAGEDDFRWSETHDHILGIIFDYPKSEPVPSDEIFRFLAEGENRGSAHYDGTTFKTEVPRALNALARNGYVRQIGRAHV